MEGVEKLKRLLFSLQPLTEAEWESQVKYFTYREFKKGESIISEGETEQYLYYIEQGVTRSYFTRKGKEFTVDFHFEGDIITGFYSLITGGPSLLTLEFISDGLAILLPFKEIEGVYRNSINSNIIGRKMAEMQYIKRLHKEMDLLSLTAEERYSKLLNQNPHLVKKILIKHLSSYLGIHPESLSRIRKNHQ